MVSPPVAATVQPGLDDRQRWVLRRMARERGEAVSAVTERAWAKWGDATPVALTRLSAEHAAWVKRRRLVVRAAPAAQGRRRPSTRAPRRARASRATRVARAPDDGPPAGGAGAAAAAASAPRRTP